MFLFAETFRENIGTNNGDQGLFLKKLMKNFVWKNIEMFSKGEFFYYFRFFREKFEITLDFKENF